MKEFEATLRLIDFLGQIFIGVICLWEGWTKYRGKEMGFLWVSVGFLALTLAVVVWR